MLPGASERREHRRVPELAQHVIEGVSDEDGGELNARAVNIPRYADGGGARTSEPIQPSERTAVRRNHRNHFSRGASARASGPSRLCGTYLELDSLADDDHPLAPWFHGLRASSAPDTRAQACGFHTNADLAASSTAGAAIALPAPCRAHFEAGHLNASPGPDKERALPAGHRATLHPRGPPAAARAAVLPAPPTPSRTPTPPPAPARPAPATPALAARPVLLPCTPSRVLSSAARFTTRPAVFVGRLRLHAERHLRRPTGHRFSVAARLSLARRGEEQKAPGVEMPW